MENILDIKTKSKIIISFLVIFAATIFTIGFSTINIKTIDKINAEIDELELIGNFLVAFRSDVNRAMVVEQNLLLPNKKNIENVLNEMQDFNIQSLKTFDQVGGYIHKYPKIKSEIDYLKAQIIEYVTFRKSLMTTMSEGRVGEALSFSDQMIDKYDKIRDDIMKLEDSIRLDSKNLRGHVMYLKGRLEKMGVLFAILLTSIIVTIAIYIVRIFSQISSELRRGIEVLSTSSAEILSTIAEISAGAAETATAVAETSATIEEVRQTASVANQKAKILIDSSQRVAESVEKGRNSLNEIVHGMEHIDLHMKKISDTVLKLSEQNRRIGDITSTVSDIADQSNLLAVNAAIEAAKAGEHGRGFTIIAQEIRNLADQSKRATQQVKEILNEVNKSVSNAVGVTVEAAKTVETGKELVVQSEDIIDLLAHNIEDAGEVSLQISSSNHQQMAGMDQIVPAMENIKTATEQNVKGLHLTQNATQSIHSIGLSIKEIMNKYKL